MMDGGRAWRIDGWQSWLTWGRVVWPTCRLAVASIAACLLPEVVTWADRPGQARPRAGPVESLHCSVAAAALDWTGSDLAPPPLFVSLYILLGPSGRACRCSALWLSLRRPAELYKSLVNGLCLLVCWHDTWLARGWTAATVSILREGERWLYPPPPWSRADCHFRARRGEMWVVCFRCPGVVAVLGSVWISSFRLHESKLPDRGLVAGWVLDFRPVHPFTRVKTSRGKGRLRILFPVRTVTVAGVT